MASTVRRPELWVDTARWRAAPLAAVFVALTLVVAWAATRVRLIPSGVDVGEPRVAWTAVEAERLEEQFEEARYLAARSVRRLAPRGHRLRGT